jgi:predicted transcriptional regulator
MLTGERLRALRKERRLTADEAAEFLKMGRTQLLSYETGKTDPTTEVFTRMVKFYGVSADYLLGLADMPKRKVLSWNFDLPSMVAAMGAGNVGRVVRMSNAPVVPVRINVPELIEQFGVEIVAQLLRELDADVDVDLSAKPAPQPDEE